MYEQKIIKLFEKFEENDIVYVIPRKYDNLPKSINLEDDIDLIIHSDDFYKAKILSEELGFTQSQNSWVSHIFQISLRTLQHPIKSAKIAINKPKKAIQILQDKNKLETKSGHQNVKLYFNKLMLDMRNGLAYKSPMDGSRIRIDPKVDKHLFSQRNKNGIFYVPSPPDELTHIICHCIYDKYGQFTQYYRDRCDKLIECIKESKQLKQRYLFLLGEIFYSASNLVYELSIKKQFDRILPQLYSYSNY